MVAERKIQAGPLQRSNRALFEGNAPAAPRNLLAPRRRRRVRHGVGMVMMVMAVVMAGMVTIGMVIRLR